MTEKIENGDALRHIKEAMAETPQDAPVAALMRHAERPKIPKGESGNDFLLTERGMRESEAAGKLLKGCIARLMHSPIVRCRQTADCVGVGAGYNGAREEWLGLSRGLYAPSLENYGLSMHHYVKESYDVFLRRLSKSGDNSPYPQFGFSAPFPATVELARRVFGACKPGLRLAVTHDWVVNTAVAYVTGKPTRSKKGDKRFPKYLDALFVWRRGDSWRFYYKGDAGACHTKFDAALTRALEWP